MKHPLLSTIAAVLLAWCATTKRLPVTIHEVGEEAQAQCRAFGWATPSLRPSIDLLYNIEQIIKPSRLTKALAQFG